MTRTLHVVTNPAAGSRNALSVLHSQVLPLIEKLRPDWLVTHHQTQSTEDGVRIGQLLRTVHSDTRTQVVILGGDGTTHDLLNGLISYNESNVKSLPQVDIALVPTGTANALYASLYTRHASSEDPLLRSVKALLSDERHTYPLALSSVTTTQSGLSKTSLTHLITSHALHASILADSEALREQHPGVERFKMAFVQNASRWVDAEITLQPYAGSVLRYNPAHVTFDAVEPKDQHIHGPILYFVCVTTDRLEPSFVPAPFSGPSSKILQRPADAVDLVLLRPTRSPDLQSISPNANQFWTQDESQIYREQYASNILPSITAAMYDEGNHVDLTYKKGGGVETKGEGPLVIEYYRCAGYKWTPVSTCRTRNSQTDSSHRFPIQLDVHAWMEQLSKQTPQSCESYLIRKAPGIFL